MLLTSEPFLQFLVIFFLYSLIKLKKVDVIFWPMCFFKNDSSTNEIDRKKNSGTCFVFQRDMLCFLRHTSLDMLSNSGVEGQRAMYHRCYQLSVLLPGPHFIVHLYLDMWNYFKELNREKKFQLVIFSSLDIKCTAKRCMCLQFLPQLEAVLRSEMCQ